MWFNDSLLFAVFSFLLRKGQILKLDGNFRKKVTEELKSIFPDQLAVNPELRVDIIRVIFRRLDLVRQEGDYFRPVVERWKELSELLPGERKLLCLGAALSRDYRLYASFADNLIKTLCSAGRGFTEKSFFKIIDLFFIKNSLTVPEEKEHVLKTLLGLGYVEKSGDYYYANPAYLIEKNAPDLSAPGMKDFVIQPNFDIHVSKDISFADGIMLAVTAEIKRYSELVFFSLSRESFLRALEAGYDSASAAEFFTRLGGFPVPQNVMFSLESWEKEYRSLTFYSGIVLVADEKKRNIIDNSGHFSANLCKKLSDGVYLVNQKNISALFESFKKAGIDNVPSPDSLVPGYVESDEKKSFMPQFREDVLYFNQFSAIGLEYDKPFYPVPESVNPDSPEIRGKIDNSQFTAEQKEVLAGRIERKLILFPEQISKGNARYEKTEARGLDYNGKVRIAEEVAGNSGYLVEIMENNSEGEAVKRLMKAEKLEKDGANYFLKGVILPDESGVSISISKLSLIRKIRTSLFVK